MVFPPGIIIIIIMFGHDDYVEDNDEDCYELDDTVDEHDDSGVTLVSEDGNIEIFSCFIVFFGSIFLLVLFWTQLK